MDVLALQRKARVAYIHSGLLHLLYSFFFFNDTATTEIYTTYDTLSIHDALPISFMATASIASRPSIAAAVGVPIVMPTAADRKSTRLNSVTVGYLVCRLLLEKKKKKKKKKEYSHIKIKKKQTKVTKNK